MRRAEGREDDMAEDDKQSKEKIEDEPDEDLDEDIDLDEDLDEAPLDFEAGDETEVADKDDEDDEDDEDEDAPTPPKAGDEEEDDDEADPDDVEADLDTILKDRIAAGDDEEEEDEEEVAPQPADTTGERVAPKREDEWTCQGCFLIVSARQFGKRSDPRCPSGEDPCPSLKRVKG